MKKVYLGKEWRYADPNTQCVLTGILIRRSDEKPAFMAGKSDSKWVKIRPYQIFPHHSDEV